MKISFTHWQVHIDEKLFNISQPSISWHLDVLKRAEIITAERTSIQRIYSLNLSVVQEILVHITDLLDMKEGAVYEDQ